MNYATNWNSTCLMMVYSVFLIVGWLAVWILLLELLDVGGVDVVGPNMYKTVDDVQRNYFQSPLKSIFGYVVAVGISSSLYKITSTTLSSLLITTYWALLFKIVIYNKHYT